LFAGGTANCFDSANKNTHTTVADLEFGKHETSWAFTMLYKKLLYPYVSAEMIKNIVHVYKTFKKNNYNVYSSLFILSCLFAVCA